jgi:hypothetical protein
MVGARWLVLGSKRAPLLVTLVGGGTGQVEQQRGFFIVMGVLALLSMASGMGQRRRRVSGRSTPRSLRAR